MFRCIFLLFCYFVTWNKEICCNTRHLKKEKYTDLHDGSIGQPNMPRLAKQRSCWRRWPSKMGVKFERTNEMPCTMHGRSGNYPVMIRQSFLCFYASFGLLGKMDVVCCLCMRKCSFLVLQLIEGLVQDKLHSTLWKYSQQDGYNSFWSFGMITQMFTKSCVPCVSARHEKKSAIQQVCFRGLTFRAIVRWYFLIIYYFQFPRTLLFWWGRRLSGPIIWSLPDILFCQAIKFLFP